MKLQQPWFQSCLGPFSFDRDEKAVRFFAMKYVAKDDGSNKYLRRIHACRNLVLKENNPVMLIKKLSKYYGKWITRTGGEDRRVRTNSNI